MSRLSVVFRIYLVKNTYRTYIYIVLKYLLKILFIKDQFILKLVCTKKPAKCTSVEPKGTFLIKKGIKPNGIEPRGTFLNISFRLEYYLV